MAFAGIHICTSVTAIVIENERPLLNSLLRSLKDYIYYEIFNGNKDRTPFNNHKCNLPFTLP